MLASQPHEGCYDVNPGDEGELTMSAGDDDGNNATRGNWSSGPGGATDTLTWNPNPPPGQYDMGSGGSVTFQTINEALGRYTWERRDASGNIIEMGTMQDKAPDPLPENPRRL